MGGIGRKESSGDVGPDRDEDAMAEDRKDILDGWGGLVVSFARYSQRDHQAKGTTDSQMMSSFIFLEEGGRVSEVRFWFPGILGGGVPFLRGQVQSMGFGALVEENGLDFIFFLVIDNVRQWV